jgi:hypothetical protein
MIKGGEKMNIHDYAKYPTPEEWDGIYQKKKSSLDKLNLANEKRKFNILDFDEGYYGIQLSYGLSEFNNRSFDLVNNYIILMSYYNEGIPDDQWYISPGKNGHSVQYFPDFEAKHYILHYWFGFYMESYYTRFSGMIDTVYHLINLKYRFEIDPTVGFIKKVLKKLESEDKILYDYLKTIPNNTVYEKVNEFRNNIVHNFRPNQVDSGFERKKQPDGSEIISMSIGNYTPSSVFVKNIEDSIDLLADIIDHIKGKFII